MCGPQRRWHTQQCRWVEGGISIARNAAEPQGRGGRANSPASLPRTIPARSPALGARRSRRPGSGRYPYSSPWVSAAAFIPPGGGLSTCVNNRRRVLCLRHRRIVLAINMDPKIFASVRSASRESLETYNFFWAHRRRGAESRPRPRSSACGSTSGTTRARPTSRSRSRAAAPRRCSAVSRTARRRRRAVLI